MVQLICFKGRGSLGSWLFSLALKPPHLLAVRLLQDWVPSEPVRLGIQAPLPSSHVTQDKLSSLRLSFFTCNMEPRISPSSAYLRGYWEGQ